MTPATPPSVPPLRYLITARDAVRDAARDAARDVAFPSTYLCSSGQGCAPFSDSRVESAENYPARPDILLRNRSTPIFPTQLVRRQSPRSISEQGFSEIENRSFRGQGSLVGQIVTYHLRDLISTILESPEEDEKLGFG